MAQSPANRLCLRRNRCPRCTRAAEQGCNRPRRRTTWLGSSIGSHCSPSDSRRASGTTPRSRAIGPRRGRQAPQSRRLHQTRSCRQRPSPRLPRRPRQPRSHRHRRYLRSRPRPCRPGTSHRSPCRRQPHQRCRRYLCRRWRPCRRPLSRRSLLRRCHRWPLRRCQPRRLCPGCLPTLRRCPRSLRSRFRPIRSDRRREWRRRETSPSCSCHNRCREAAGGSPTRRGMTGYGDSSCP
jgi:hypothetical protein